MNVKSHFLNLVDQKGGFKPLHAHFDKSNVVTPDILMQAQKDSMQDKWHTYNKIKANYTFQDVYNRAEKCIFSLIKQKVKLSSLVKSRLIKFLLSLIIVSIAVLIIIFNLRDNIIYFYGPTELLKNSDKQGQIMRLGGLVSVDSFQNETDSIFYFSITDGENEIDVKYEGILPNLFAEDKGVVVEGVYMNDGRFIANKVLAKHDENYMPPEVIETLKKSGKWQGE